MHGGHPGVAYTVGGANRCYPKCGPRSTRRFFYINGRGHVLRTLAWTVPTTRAAPGCSSDRELNCLILASYCSAASGRPGRVLPVFRPCQPCIAFRAWLCHALKRAREHMFSTAILKKRGRLGRHGRNQPSGTARCAPYTWIDRYRSECY